MILNVIITTALGRTREQFRLNEQFFGEDEEEVIEFGGRPVLSYIVLSTTSIRREDAGEYRCAVNNTAGQQTEVNITVNVQGEQVQLWHNYVHQGMCTKTCKFVLDKLWHSNHWFEPCAVCICNKNSKVTIVEFLLYCILISMCFCNRVDVNMLA